MLCRSSAKAGQGKSRFQHPLKGKVANPVSFLSGVCSQASGVLIQDLWSCTESTQPVLLHSIKSTGVLGNGSFLGGNSSVWCGHGEGQDLGGFPVELWAQECSLSCVAASSISCLDTAALRPRGSNELPAFSRLGRRDQADPSGSTAWGARATADGFCPSPWIQGYSCGVLTHGNAQSRVGDNSLDPGARGFPKPGLSCKCT